MMKFIIVSNELQRSLLPAMGSDTTMPFGSVSEVSRVTE